MFIISDFSELLSYNNLKKPLNTAFSLIKESLCFVEWTAPTLVEVDVEQATELVDVGRTLARWEYHWEKISQDEGALS